MDVISKKEKNTDEQIALDRFNSRRAWNKIKPISDIVEKKAMRHNPTQKIITPCKNSNAGLAELNLLRCPFCNKPPAVDYLPGDLVVISCQWKEGCGIRPSTYEHGLRLELAKKKWNQRPKTSLEKIK